MKFLVTELLKRGANLETKDNYGYTPLLKAVKNGARTRSMVDLLLERGANVHALTEDAKSVLHFVAQTNDEDLMRMLFEKDLSKLVNAEDKNGSRPLHEAARSGNELTAIVLIANGQC